MKIRKAEKKAIEAKMKQNGFCWEGYQKLGIYNKGFILLLIVNLVMAYYKVGLYKYFFTSITLIMLPFFAIIIIQDTKKQIRLEFKEIFSKD